MNTRWRKVWADLRAYRLQIGLIALVLVGGAAGVVAALDARAVLQRAIPASFAGAVAPDLVLWFDRIDEALLAGVAAQPGVAAVAARRVTFSRVSVGTGPAFPMRLALVGDPLAQPVARVHRHGGGSAAAEGLWLEQSGADLLGVRVGEQLTVRTPGGGTVQVPLAGFVHDLGVAPSTQERLVYAYATTALAQRLGQNPQPDQLLVKMTQRRVLTDAVEMGNDLVAWAKAAQRAPLRMEVLPAEHPHALLMDALLRVLGALSAIAFTSSAAWAAYMVSLWMRREVRVIGILKTLGARSHQIALQYLALVAPLVLLAGALAVPLGSALGRLLVQQQQVSLNIDVADWSIAPGLRQWELVLALGLPLLAVGLPVLRAARLTPRQALFDADQAAPGGVGRWRARWLRVPGAVRWTLALRNSFRRPWRLALIVLALGSGGALLLTTHSNYESLMSVIDHSLAQQGHDLEVLLQRPAPAAALQALVQAQGDVARVEAWRRTGVSLGAAAGPPGPAASVHEAARWPLVGYPAASQLMRLRVTEGRAPRDGAVDEVLVSRNLLAQQAGLRLGQGAVFRHREREVTLRLVGLVEEIGQATVYAPFSTFEALTGMGDASTSLRVKAGAGVALEPLARQLDQLLLDAQHTPAQIVTRDLVRDSLDEHFKVVGDFIRMVALATALVGAIWLAASSALNVLERTREIGVLRALGATPRDIAAICLAEALAVALLSALLAIAASIVLTLAFNRAAETGLLHVAVPLQFSLHGLAILGAGAAVLVAAVALALWRVLRLSTRQALNYE